MIETRTTHACGGSLVFTRQANGCSTEKCEGCGWRYNFDAPSVNDLAGIRIA